MQNLQQAEHMLEWLVAKVAEALRNHQEGHSSWIHPGCSFLVEAHQPEVAEEEQSSA